MSPNSKPPFVVAIDVDLTVVDPTSKWIQWFNDRCLTPQGRITEEIWADPSTPILEYMDPYLDGCCGLDWWETPDIYDDVEPIAGSVSAICAMVEAGAHIVFVSHCMAGHKQSKINFLARNFPDHGFIDTKDKHFVGYDLLIDDDARFLSQCVTMHPHRKYIMYPSRQNMLLGETYYKSLLAWGVEPVNGWVGVLDQFFTLYKGDK